MAENVVEITTAQKNDRTRRLLNAELARITARLRSEADVPMAGVVGGDFLDIAQGIEHQELARLSASRLVDRARRLRIALTRVSDGEYGICSECGAPIPPRRLLAVPDATACVTCQSRLERAGGAGPDAGDPAEEPVRKSA